MIRKKWLKKSSVMLTLLTVGLVPVATLISEPAQTVSASTVSKSPTGLEVDGSFGPATIADLQIRLNQNNYGPALVVDGVFGSATIKSLQHFLGVTQDGVFGPITIKALQSYLNNLPVYWKGTQTGKLTVDGVFGSATTKHLQAWLNVCFDL